MSFAGHRCTRHVGDNAAKQFNYQRKLNPATSVTELTRQGCCSDLRSAFQFDLPVARFTVISFFARKTRAALSPGNRAKPRKFRSVKPVGNFIRKIQRSKEKTRHVLTTALAYDTTSPANPDEYRHKHYIARNRRPRSLPLQTYLAKSECLTVTVQLCSTLFNASAMQNR